MKLQNNIVTKAEHHYIYLFIYTNVQVRALTTVTMWKINTGNATEILSCDGPESQRRLYFGK